MTLSEVFDTFNKANTGLESVAHKRVSVQVESSLLPTFTVNVFDDAEPSWLMKLAKPRVTVLGEDGTPLYVAAPAGEPVKHLGTILLIAGVLASWYVFFR